MHGPRVIALLLLVIGLLTSPTVAQPDRWIYIGTGTDESKHYLDATTIERPDKDSVIFWRKIVEPNKAPRMHRIAMWRDRLYGYVDVPGSKTLSVPPESLLELFYYQLFPTIPR